MKELLLAILLAMIFYIVAKNRNTFLIKPSDEKMSNVDYQADDINAISPINF